MHLPISSAPSADWLHAAAARTTSARRGAPELATRGAECLRRGRRAGGGSGGGCSTRVLRDPSLPRAVRGGVARAPWHAHELEAVS